MLELVRQRGNLCAGQNKNVRSKQKRAPGGRATAKNTRLFNQGRVFDTISKRLGL